MENKEDFAIGYIPSEKTDDGMPLDNFMNNMAALMLLAICGAFDGAHPEAPENKE